MAPPYGYVRPYSAVPAGGPLVFWPIGDSITRGTNGAAGWRHWLYVAAVAAGVSPAFVGALLNSDDGLSDAVAGHAHNGNNGAFGTTWYSTYFDFYLPYVTPSYIPVAPNVIGIAVGANDTDDAAHAIDFCRLMDKAAAAFPLANVLFATRTWATADTGAQAAQVRLEVARRRAQGMNVTLVDAHALGPRGIAGTTDGLHPGDEGYRVLGDLWTAALLPLLRAA